MNKLIKEFLDQEMQKEYFLKMMQILKEKYKTKSILPQKEDILRAIKELNVDKLKIVIIGQDPYPTKGVADGLAFSTRDNSIPASLKNIYSEIKKSYPNFNKIDGDLSPWFNQGVLLLNRVLTVEQGKPNSMKGIGWEIFTANFLKFLNSKKENLIYLLLGNEAQKLEKEISLDNQVVIKLSHPSPLGYRKSFYNSLVFGKINDLLETLNKEKIEW